MMFESWVHGYIRYQLISSTDDEIFTQVSIRYEAVRG